MKAKGDATIVKFEIQWALKVTQMRKECSPSGTSQVPSVNFQYMRRRSIEIPRADTILSSVSSATRVASVSTREI